MGPRNEGYIKGKPSVSGYVLDMYKQRMHLWPTFLLEIYLPHGITQSSIRNTKLTPLVESSVNRPIRSTEII